MTIELSALETRKLFNASCIALITTSMTFAIRGALMDTWGTEFALTGEEIGWVNSTAFLGFTLSMLVGGPLCDVLGMRNLLRIAFFGHLLGIGLTISATGYYSLFYATLVIGISNGMVEAACNPLITALFPNEKIKFLNRFHIWFPGGIVIGGLLSYLFLERLHLPWPYLMTMLILPNLIYGYLAFKARFPVSERMSSGTSNSEMYKALLHPLFLIMVGCMFLTAATELGTNQWITALLANVGVPSILLLVFINGIMAVGRGFAGELAHRLRPEGMLLLSAVFSALGLVLLSYAQGYQAFGAAAVFAVGICYFWPTMLGFVSVYTPKTGPMGLSIMGGAGMFSVYLILPFMGKTYDQKLASLIPEGMTLESLKNAVAGSTQAQVWSDLNLMAGSETLFSVVILPLFLIVAFTGILFWVKGKGDISKNP